MNLKNVKICTNNHTIQRFTFLVFNNAGVDLSKSAIYSCQTGTTASTLAFIAHILGQKSYSVYHVRLSLILPHLLHISISSSISMMFERMIFFEEKKNVRN
jgi:hypothetical protein